MKKNKKVYEDKVYRLTRDAAPLSYMLSSKHTKRKALLYFDEETGINRALRYARNQKSIFEDEQDGNVILEPIVFEDGFLNVSKTNQTLQKFLSLYHPHNGKLFYEHNPVEVAENQLGWLEMEVEALTVAKNIDIDMAEAIMRAEKGSKVADLSSKELKRDLLLFARRNPSLFLELVNDENVQLRNFGIKAVEANIIKLSNDQRYFSWGSNNRKLMTVPFDEHPYSALAQWFKTDEGMEIYSNIEKRMN